MNDRSKTFENAYQTIVGEDDARYCKDISEDACKVVPGNFFTILLANLFTKLGDSLIGAKTVLPWMMSSMGAPASLVGLLVPIRESGSLLPQLFIAGLIRRLPVRKWVWVAGSVAQGVAIVAMALIAMVMDGVAGGVALLGALTLFSLARGFCSIASKDVLGKTIPKKRRGRVSGLSASLAGIVTLGAGVLLMLRPSEEGQEPLMWLLYMGAGLWFVAAAVFARVKESPGETDGGSSFLNEGLKKFALLKTDGAFRDLCICRSLLLASALSAPYYVTIARERSEELSMLGMLMLAAGAAALVSGNFWGQFSDQSSRKVLIVSGVLTGLCGASVFLLDGLWPSSPAWVFVLAFFVLEVIHNGVRLGRKTYVVDMADGNKRTDYVATSNTLIGFILLLVGGLGLLAQVIGAAGMVAIFAGMASLGAFWATKLPEVTAD